MTIYTYFITTPDQKAIIDSTAITDHLKAKLQPLADAVQEAGAKLILYDQEDVPRKLVVDGQKGLQKEIRDLVEPAETWSL